MKHINKVEAYFDNTLGEAEKQDFFKEIESNPELKSEFDFQNEIINGIKEARKAELKAMLNKVKVSIAPINNSSTGLLKMFLSTTSILIAGTAFWYYYNSKPILDNTQDQKLAEQQLSTSAYNTIESVASTSNQIETNLDYSVALIV